MRFGSQKRVSADSIIGEICLLISPAPYIQLINTSNAVAYALCSDRLPHNLPQQP